MTIIPSRNADGTIEAVIQSEKAPFHNMNLLRMALPSGLVHGQMAGRYFLARCGARTESERVHSWSIYARRPLFAAHIQTAPLTNDSRTATGEDNPADIWTLTVPAEENDPGAEWLRELPTGAAVNLIGPLGRGFTLDRDGMNLLLIADIAHLPRLLSLIEPALDKRCRVTLVVLDRVANDEARAALLDLLPLAAELQVANDLDDLWRMLREIVTWADQLCVAMPALPLAHLAELVRAKRFRLEDGFAQILVDAPLICGVGACLACVMPLANGGLTRACVHGPVFDLRTLARA